MKIFELKKLIYLNICTGSKPSFSNLFSSMELVEVLVSTDTCYRVSSHWWWLVIKDDWLSVALRVIFWLKLITVGLTLLHHVTLLLCGVLVVHNRHTVSDPWRNRLGSVPGLTSHTCNCARHLTHRQRLLNTVVVLVVVFDVSALIFLPPVALPRTRAFNVTISLIYRVIFSTN